MRLTKRKHGTSVSMNMTPMIDIVFLLLIFFMTVTQVSRTNNEPVDLPKEKGSADQVDSPLTVNIDATGDVIVSGRRMTVAELVSRVADEVASQGGDTNRVSVVIRADRKGTSQTVNQVVDALARIGIARLRFAVEVNEF